jgi:flagellar motor component MotA
MKTKLIISLILILGCAAIGIYFSGGECLTFIDIPTFMCVDILAFLILLASWPIKDIGRAFSKPFSGEATPADLRKAREFFSSLRRALVWAGILAVVLGFVLILKQLPVTGSASASASTVFSMERLGANMAVTILSIFYTAASVIVLCLPFESAARRRLAETGE